MTRPDDDARAIEPVGPALRALFDAERGRPGMDAALRSKIRANVHARSSGVSTPPAEPGQPRPAPRRSRWAELAAAAGLGVIAGAVGHAVLTSAPLAPQPAPPVSVVIASPSPPPPSPPPPAAPAESASTPVATSASAPVPTTAAPPASHAVRSDGVDVSLDAERTLLERARAALQRRDPEGALEAVRLHEQRFSRGKLRDERELVAVRALVASGQAERAEERARRFEESAPDSPLLPAIRRAAEKSGDKR